MKFDKYSISLPGFQKLKKKLNKLISSDRPRVMLDIYNAKKHGDLSENAEYQAARDKQRILDNKIIKLKNRIAKSKVISIITYDKIVQFGSSVLLLDLLINIKIRVKVLGDCESNSKYGIISIISPLGMAILNKGIGNVVIFFLPNGLIKKYKIINIR